MKIYFVDYIFKNQVDFEQKIDILIKIYFTCIIKLDLKMMFSLLITNTHRDCTSDILNFFLKHTLENHNLQTSFQSSSFIKMKGKQKYDQPKITLDFLY